MYSEMQNRKEDKNRGDKRKIHISIDDVQQSFVNSFLLFSMKKNNFYKYLFFLHKKYGIKITLFVQNWEYFSELNGNTVDYLAKESNWLKFGIHSPKYLNDFEKLSYSEGNLEVQNFFDEFMRLGFSKESLDSFQRLHRFVGSKECIKGMRKCEHTWIKGLLTSDDSRASYYLDKNLNELIYMRGEIVYDEATDIIFKSTDIRLDWFDKKFKNNNIYNRPQKKRPYDELVFRYEKGEFDNKEIITIFTHEWQIYRNGYLTSRKYWIEDVCRFARDYGFEFGFPGDVLSKERALNVNSDEIKRN